mmetsp:Transcript_26677/g.39230  ORF Transcript_26677/g.39230 Transcript_26677/m.39230 type:complete len:111 (-) Transcript_26677:359-691(-)
MHRNQEFSEHLLSSVNLLLEFAFFEKEVSPNKDTDVPQLLLPHTAQKPWQRCDFSMPEALKIHFLHRQEVSILARKCCIQARFYCWPFLVSHMIGSRATRNLTDFDSFEG